MQKTIFDVNKQMKTVINELELGFAPISAYDFKVLINETAFHKFVNDSHLYIITQRRELTFNNFSYSDKTIKFEIRQDENQDFIECILPIYQKSITLDTSKHIKIKFYNRKAKEGYRSKPPHNGTQSLAFEELNDVTGEIKHLLWLSPERLFHCYYNEEIEVHFNKDYRQLLQYKVHYVGKSTEQNICSRLSKHSTFQEILTNQSALTYGNIPSNEIVVLLFKISSNNSITSWGVNESEEELANFIRNYNCKDDKTISLDAEKALIKHLQPKYNKILYKSYPTNTDLINNDFHNSFLYCIIDPVTLIYNHGQIKGSKLINERDYIEVSKIN